MRSIFKTDPEYVLSFNGFQNNDKHFINYLREHGWTGDYITVNKCLNTTIPNTKCIEDAGVLNSLPAVDVIGCVAPCAGLSSLSPTSNSDSPVNDWMYKSASFILESVKPKIFWGENSIFLSAKKGEPVANKLAKIGFDNNYYFLVYSTENRFHGSPQKRARTFYFYFRKDVFTKCPKLDKLPFDFLNVETLLDNCEKVKQPNDPMDEIINQHEELKDNPWYQYWMDYYKVNTHRELVESISSLDNKTNSQSLVGMACIKNKNDFTPLKQFFKNKGFDKAYDKAVHIENKFKQGKSAWLYGPQIDRGMTPSFVGQIVLEFVHPRFQRYLTFREALAMMAMPMDFNLIGNKAVSFNHIAQNVCVTTAEAMSKEVKKILLGNAQVIDESDKDIATYFLIDHRKDDSLTIRTIV